MNENPEERIRRARETLEVLRRAHPAAHPTPEDVAALHELHAEHERSVGHFEQAEKATRRAERTRRLSDRSSAAGPPRTEPPEQ